VTLDGWMALTMDETDISTRTASTRCFQTCETMDMSAPAAARGAVAFTIGMW